MNRPTGIKSAHSRAKGDMWYDTDSQKMMYSLGPVTEADIKQDWRRVFNDAPYNAHWVDDEVFSAATGVTLGNTVQTGNLRSKTVPSPLYGPSGSPGVSCHEKQRAKSHVHFVAPASTTQLRLQRSTVHYGALPVDCGVVARV